MTISRCIAASIAVVVTLGPSAEARAETAAEAEASRLYQQGKAEMSGGHYADACPMFERSLELDPEPGTALNLALCDEQIGKLASAWYMWLRAAVLSGAKEEREREDMARKRAAALEPRLPRLRVDVTPQSHDGQVVVRVDGRQVGTDQWSAALPVDPGVHRIDAHVGGCRAWFTDVDADDGKAQSITVPVLEDLDDGGGRRTVALSLGVGALATAAAAGAFGFEALAASNRIASKCAPTRNQDCNSGDLHNWSLVQTYGTVADVGFAVAGAELLGAALLWFGAPRRTTSVARWTVHPLVATTGAGLSIGESW
jgi:tetratricopeptide (TPR) repeat protein